MSWCERNPEVVFTDMGDGAVLLHMERRLYFSLNGTGVEVWRLLEEVESQEELGVRLSEGWGVDQEGARSLAAPFLERLVAEDLVAMRGEVGLAEEPPPPAAGGPEPPELVQHDEPLHEVSTSPFDPQLPLAE